MLIASPRRLTVVVALGSAALLPLHVQAQTPAPRPTATPAAPSASPASPASAAAPALEYRLAAGDVIRVNVYQNPDLALEARVPEDGVISYPLVGAVRVGGQTIAQVERAIAEGLRSGNFVRSPQVNVNVVAVRGNQASALGQVNRPGRFPIEVVGMRLSDLLALAGGVSSAGADSVVLVGTRDGRPFRREIDVPSLFRSEERSDDVVIANGDVLFVDRAPMVYIYGEVQRPGAFRLDRGMTLMQALAAGGGLTPRGTEKGIRVHRKNPDGSIRVLTPAMDERLGDADVVYVRESIF
jgi:polysaccharide export outer membrane protein